MEDRERRALAGPSHGLGCGQAHGSLAVGCETGQALPSLGVSPEQGCESRPALGLSVPFKIPDQVFHLVSPRTHGSQALANGLRDSVVGGIG